ncbi:MAG: transcriptional repressor [Candidatus Gastranaerophilales bacterium]|nr:transcriptional repressor [Candidatus Gastranaerophilales bacterium]MCM1525742.1 transcriptional repressor [Bacteroides sp.]
MSEHEDCERELRNADGITVLRENIEYPGGIKWTRQRKCVYQILWQAKEPLSARRIYQAVEELMPEDACALSTIYRILTAFVDRGLVSSTTWPGDDTELYELERGGHTHYAVCLDCHKRISLSGCPFTIGHFAHRGGQSDDKELADFTVIGHKVELYGYCSKCNANR